MKMDIDFEKLTKEALDEAISNLPPDEEMAHNMKKAVMSVSSKVVAIALKKYHQALLKD